MVSPAKITCLNKVWGVHCPLFCINKKIKPFIDFKNFSIKQERLTEDQSVFVNIYGVQTFYSNIYIFSSHIC